MSAVKGRTRYRKIRNDWPASAIIGRYRLEAERIEPECFVCGELAEYVCDWIVRHYVDHCFDPAGRKHDCSQTHLCEANVCYRHVREVADGLHYCVNHWDQTSPSQAAEVRGPLASVEKAQRAPLNQQLRWLR